MDHPKEKQSPSNKFEENYTEKYYNILGVTFWDSDNNISELQEKPLGNSDKDIMKYKIALDILLNRDKRQRYNSFLFFNYILSQPFTLVDLENKFKNIIFPYYIFSIIYQENYSFLILDFIDFTWKIRTKDIIVKTILPRNISSIHNQKGLWFLVQKDGEEIQMNSELQVQNNLIVLWFHYMILMNIKIQSKRSGNEECGINQVMDNTEICLDTNCNIMISKYNILNDDSYIPSGAILKASVLKQQPNTIMCKCKRYAILGVSYVILFRDETMKDIRNIIPWLHFHIYITYSNAAFMIKFTWEQREIIIYFATIDEYFVWKGTLLDISQGRIYESIEESTLIAVKKEDEDKIWIDIDEELKWLNEDLFEIEEKEYDLIKSYEERR